jgi:aminoglycoside phosphotransferase (APT) family kinase protein
MESILHRFSITNQAQVLRVDSYGQGHIHQSFKVSTDQGPFFLQKINQNVFPEPDLLMNQMLAVTRHLNQFYRKQALPYRVPELHLSADEKPFVIDDQSYWRLFDFVEESFSVDVMVSRAQVAHTAEAFAFFIEGLSSLDLEGAYYPIKNFHNLRGRHQQLKDAVQSNQHLAEDVSHDIATCEKLIEQLVPLIRKIETEWIPTRWTHNDTKLNNLLFNKEGRPISVVDLDTVMPGCILYDVGDVLRTTCSNLSEDDPAIQNMQLDTLKRDWFVEAFARHADKWITLEEIHALSQSGALMATLMATRFLTDHINGDVYYKIEHSGQNLNRARNQMQLARLFLEMD